MSDRVCLVLNCFDNDQRKFSLPNPFKDRPRALQWMSACGNINKKRSMEVIVYLPILLF